MQVAVAERLQWGRIAVPRTLFNWALCWIILPNASFWLLWVVGGPPRTLETLVIGLVGIAVHRAPFSVKFAAFLGAIIYSVLNFTSSLFSLSIASLVYSLELAAELKPAASVEYLVCGVALILTLVAGWRLLRLPTTLAQPLRFAGAIILTIAAASLDYSMSLGSRGSYSRVATPGALFTSAAQASGIESLATGNRHIVMIMVEAMGLPQDPKIRRELVNIWARPEVRAHYEVVTGDTLFYGSTTGGEMRELCGRWGDYFEVLDRKDTRCLPTRLAAKGYGTQAWHSFTGNFFERNRWYPNIGFREMRFGDRIVKDGAGVCPGVFAGACDRDVPSQIAAALKHASGPQFLYWLTVNSHLPVIRNEALQTIDCARFDSALNDRYPMTCRLFSLYDQTGRALAKEITAADFPDADILIVGDHLPPFFDRHHRQAFAPDLVPWILLKRKAGAPAQMV
jgi:hypothetical protein